MNRIICFLILIQIILASCSPMKSPKIKFSNSEIEREFSDSVAFMCIYDSTREYNIRFRNFVKKYNLPFNNFNFFNQFYYSLNVDTSIYKSAMNDRCIRLTALPYFDRPSCLIIRTCSLGTRKVTELKLRLTNGDGINTGVPYYENTLYDSLNSFEQYSNVLSLNGFWTTDADNNIDSLKKAVYDPTKYRLEANIDGKYKLIKFTSTSYGNKKLMNILRKLDSIQNKLKKPNLTMYFAQQHLPKRRAFVFARTFKSKRIFHFLS